MKREFAEFIEKEFRECVSNTVVRLDAEDTHRPFHSALLSKQALFWSRFERSFSTSFGQRVIEKISRVAALSGGAENAQNQKETIISLSASQLTSIEEHIQGLRSGKAIRAADWNSDIAELLSIDAGEEKQRTRVISDLWWRKNGVNHYMSIKTVKPNIDQTAEAKRDLLKLKLAEPTANVYYGLYYNPYGEDKSSYNWSPPKKIFNFNADSCVLIGKEYWDTLGGRDFYEEVLAIAEKVGEETRKQVENLYKETAH